MIGDYVEDAVATLFEQSGYSMERFGVERLFRKHLDVINAERDADSSARNKKAFDQQQQFIGFLRSFPDFVAVRRDAGSRGYHAAGAA